jgi:murein L,D-transpeptidase YcbB/YkuD
MGASARVRWESRLLLVIISIALFAGLPANATVASPLPVDASTGAESSTQAQIRSLINSGRLAILRWPDFGGVRGQVAEFYADGAYWLAWIRNGRPTPQALAMIRLFKQAAFKGLDPEDYDASRWSARIATIERPGGINAAHFDLALTVCAIRYISALEVGRVNPHHIEFAPIGPAHYDLAHLLRNSVINAQEVSAALAKVEPDYAGYKRAEAALKVYIKLAREGDTPPLPTPKRSVHPGGTYPSLPLLVQRLHQLGDLPPSVKPAVQPPVYKGAVVDAVRHFQRRHGLEIDGVIGRNTVAALNTPLSHRVRQLDFTLERYRWIPRSFPQPPIVINIPEFRLRTMRRQPAPFLSMKVVVGKAYGHHTPVFAGLMRYVIFRPYWNVPLSIQRAELVPKIRRNPDYLAENGYEVVNHSQEVITAGRVSSAILAALRSGELEIRQRPGPKNALGLVKFIFPNDYSVYLHGTPVTELFSHARRDFSHGCIRVEHPAALALWVLRNNPGWTEDRIRAAMEGDKTLKVNLTKPIPVLILYSTAVVEPDGEVYFFRDIYDSDARLEQKLAEGYPYPH